MADEKTLDLTEVESQFLTPLGRILTRVLVTPTGCWEYQGARNAQGYGGIKVGGREGRRIGAHRIVAAELLGLDLNDGRMYVCHRCDNPPCVNPSHLFLGSNRDNQLDAVAKGRKRRKPFCKNGHDMGVHRQTDPTTGRTRCGECRRERARKQVRSRAKQVKA